MTNKVFTITSTPVFSKHMSHVLKGVAILMMLAHHCFAFPDYWLDKFCVGTIPTAICNNFKVCVAIFAFITGYGLHTGKTGTYKDTLCKVLNFLGQYWLQLFLIFLPVASVHFSFSAKRILYNMIAIYDNIVLFAWYVFFHCLVVLTFPFVKKLLTHSPVFDLAMVLVAGYCVTVMLYFQPFDGPLFSILTDCSIYYPVVGVGYLCAKYAVLDRIAQKIHILGAIGLIVVIFLLRTKVSVVKGFSFDAFYAPLLIVSLCRVLEHCRILHCSLTFLGKHSFHMWLFHSIFFSAYTRDVMQPLVNWTDISIVRFLLITALSIVAAVLIERLWSCFTLLIRQLRKRVCC